MAEGKPDSERLAVLEHRADRLDSTVEKISDYMRELTRVQSEMVKIQTLRLNDLQRLERLETLVDAVNARTAEQHEAIRNWITANEGTTRLNASWVDWFKVLLAAAIGGGSAFIFASVLSDKAF